ncbi:MAG TPA: hypothetical protein VKJ07_23480 [Mycobacteriales bacterium]|nr:hypothetical protein [Mycobacteriales bacterium]
MVLTPEEDDELRRLAALAAYGALTPALAEEYDELRARDRRERVREPRALAELGPAKTA